MPEVMNNHSCITIFFSLLLAFTIGCEKTEGPAAKPEASSEADEFQELLDASMAELQLKTEAHKAWGLGTFDQWNIDQEVGDLVFSNADGTKAVAPPRLSARSILRTIRGCGLGTTRRFLTS
ncbi:MAG: hypothetical protein AAF497_25820 [Planctomycetota bacterium]